MSALPTKRQYLNSVIVDGKPLAGLTRGRFSAAAEAHAAANTDKWAEAPVEVKVPKAPAAPKPAPAVSTAAPAPVVQTGQVNPKEVRAWAKQNGHEVGERGRIHGSVVAAFLKAGGKVTTPAAPRPTPLLMPKVRRESSGFTVVGGTLIRQDKCGNGHEVSRCACPGGVPAYKWLARETGGPLMLTLDKPAL